ncbi:MAG: hypothetical protein LV480_01290 [Methylacidiphilales bacterium]|nr:hypothetical protein [Candidatus Methylacidiphilales bacterium]
MNLLYVHGWFPGPSNGTPATAAPTSDSISYGRSNTVFAVGVSLARAVQECWTAKTVRLHGTDYLGADFDVSASVDGGTRPEERVTGVGYTNIEWYSVGILTFNWSQVTSYEDLYYPSLTMTPYNYQQNITCWGVFVEDTIEPGNPSATCFLETTEYWT